MKLSDYVNDEISGFLFGLLLGCVGAVILGLVAGAVLIIIH